MWSDTKICGEVDQISQWLKEFKTNPSEVIPNNLLTLKTKYLLLQLFKHSLSCWIIPICRYLKLELLTQFPASIDDK